MKKNSSLNFGWWLVCSSLSLGIGYPVIADINLDQDSNLDKNIEAAPPKDVNVRTFGVSPSNSDNSDAFQKLVVSLPYGSKIYIPAGVYNFKSPVLIVNQALSIVGAGSRQTVFNYSGSAKDVDCFVFGNGTQEIGGLRLSGVGFSSTTSMTGGSGVRFKLLVRSTITDVLFDHQDGNGNFYNAVWFDGVDYVTLSEFQCRAKNDGLRVSGAAGGAGPGPRADLFINHGKIGGCNVGLHEGGAFGGLYLDGIDIIGNKTNVLIDRSLNSFGNNRETFFGAGALIDSAGTGGVASGINVDIEDTGGFIFFNNSWIASAATLVKVGPSFAGNLSLTGGILFNGFRNSGGAGNAIEIYNSGVHLAVKDTKVTAIDGALAKCFAPQPARVLMSGLDVDRSPTLVNITLEKLYP